MIKITRIDDYLSSLSRKLSDVPSSEKQSILDEIRDHLEGEVQSQIENGINRQKAEENVLVNFKSPEDLSNDYLRTYEETDQKQFTFSMVLISLWIIGSIYLMMPILNGEVDIAQFVLGISVSVVAIIYLLVKRIWRRAEVKLLKSFPRLILFLHFPLSLISFWINGNINSFLLSYTAIYWIFLLISGLYFRYISKKNGLGKMFLTHFAEKR